MTDDELAAVEARCDAATPGKWYWETDYEEEGGFSLLGPNMENVGWARHECDIVFLSAVRTDVPALIAEVRRLRKELNNALRDRREAQEDYARRCSRDAFLDGANWLEHRLRDKPLSAYYTHMAWEEACKRWGEERRDAD